MKCARRRKATLFYTRETNLMNRTFDDRNRPFSTPLWPDSRIRSPKPDGSSQRRCCRLGLENTWSLATTTTNTSRTSEQKRRRRHHESKKWSIKTSSLYRYCHTRTVNVSTFRWGDGEKQVAEDLPLCTLHSHTSLLHFCRVVFNR